MSRHHVTVFVCALIVLCILGCAGAFSNVVPSPLHHKRLEDLTCTLEGTWTLRSIDAQATGQMANQQWVFRGNGSGVYKQRRGTNAVIGASVYEGDNNFAWTLDGANLSLVFEEGNRTTVYRVEHWSQQDMSWFNYLLSDLYKLERTGDGDYDGCMMRARPSAGDGPDEDDTLSEPVSP